MRDKDDFFIGWADRMPAPDRRWFVGGGVALLGVTVGGAALLGSEQDGGGTGTWDQGDVREWRGRVTSDPYPMLRTRDTDGAVRTAILSCMNKCVVKPRIDLVKTGEVIVRGSPIRRGPHLMIATADDGSWIEAAPEGSDDQALAFPEPESLGPAALRGMILDTKCWFGAMRPSSGKAHKSCASLCIRSGLPPAFFVRSRRGQESLLVMTDETGRAVGHDILPFVADWIELSGSVERRGDLLLLKTATGSFARV